MIKNVVPEIEEISFCKKLSTFIIKFMGNISAKSQSTLKKLWGLKLQKNFLQSETLRDSVAFLFRFYNQKGELLYFIVFKSWRGEVSFQST